MRDLHSRRPCGRLVYSQKQLTTLPTQRALILSDFKLSVLIKLSRDRDLDPGPAVYKTAALATELHRHLARIIADIIASQTHRINEPLPESSESELPILASVERDGAIVPSPLPAPSPRLVDLRSNIS